MMKKGTTGLSFAIPAGGGPTYGMTKFLAADRALRFDVGLAIGSQAPPGGVGDRANTFGFSVEVGYRMYKPMAGKLTGFLQPGVFLSKAPGVDIGEALSAALTGGIGVEYWLTHQWTIAGLTGVALQFLAGGGDSFSNNITLTTGTSALMTSFYW